METTVQTSITQIKPDQILVRGYDLCELMGRLSFAELVFLLLAQRLPSPAEGRLHLRARRHRGVHVARGVRGRLARHGGRERQPVVGDAAAQLRVLDGLPVGAGGKLLALDHAGAGDQEERLVDADVEPAEFHAATFSALSVLSARADLCSSAALT